MVVQAVEYDDERRLLDQVPRLLADIA